MIQISKVKGVDFLNIRNKGKQIRYLMPKIAVTWSYGCEKHLGQANATFSSSKMTLMEHSLCSEGTRTKSKSTP